MSDHAILGASSATRWINCPGSVRAISDLRARSGKEPSSFVAGEGNAAHDLAEMCLKAILMNSPKLFANKAEDYRDWDLRVKEWPDVFRVDDDMIEAVQEYLDYVDMERARLGEGTEMWVERNVKPFDDRDDMWGTLDCLLLQPFGELVVIDYKHGRGVIVEPEYNDQMMFYGLGGLRAIGPLAEDVTKVTLVVAQPRAYHEAGRIRPWSTTKDQLLDFGDTLRLAADRTYEPDAPFVAGAHCKFCPVKAGCPVYKADALGLFDIPVDSPESVDPPPVPVHDPAEVARLLKIIPRWDEFVRAVEGLAMQMAESGIKVPGNKLVRKKANRRWGDPDLVEKRLRRKPGIKVKDVFKPRELRSPAQLEKNKAIGKEWVGKNAVKPDGGLTLVPEDDKRPAVEVKPAVDLLPETRVDPIPPGTIDPANRPDFLD